jgi:hypothetical protein
MIRPLLIVTALSTLAVACAPQRPADVFIPSKKSAVELRALQSRVVPGDDLSVMRDVVATLHDLGYRITKADPDAGTVSGTRATELRLAVVVRKRTNDQSVVRANATIVAIGKEAQVDDPVFYADDFFAPLAATTGRQLAAAPEDDSIPAAVQPVAERNTLKERAQAAPPKPATP